jgi:hypothetical protein
LKSLWIVTLHNVCPEELENLEIRYNIGLVPFFNKKQDLPKFLRFVDKIKSYKGEIVLHTLCHENRRRQIDKFGTKTEAAAEFVVFFLNVLF